MMTAEELRAFEQRVAEAYNAAQIRAPVHLAGGNEENLIAIFQEVRPQDWVLAQWRSHYHCLLKGVDPERLFADILAGHSITLTYPDHRILTSAIVGGHLPIALGIAMQHTSVNVWAFMGDMSAESGIATECMVYALRQGITNIRFVIEDNGLSVATPTDEAWGPRDGIRPVHEVFRRYSYRLDWPHSGARVRINF